MKYIEFFGVKVNNKLHLLKERDEVFSYWSDEETQKYALYNGGTKIYKKNEFLKMKDKFVLSEPARDMINLLYN